MSEIELPQALLARPAGLAAPAHGRTFWYVIAVVLAIGGFTLHLLVSPLTPAQADLIFMVPAILVAGSLGGLGPGLLATALCVALDLLSPMTTTAYFGSQLITASAFAVIGIGMALFGERLRLARTNAAARTQDLLAREAHLQSLLATVPDAVIIIDEKGDIRSFSNAAERLFGYSAAETIGQNVRILMPSPDREAHDGYIRRYLETRAAAHYRGRTRRGGRAQGWLDVSNRLIDRRIEFQWPSILHRLCP